MGIVVATAAERVYYNAEEKGQLYYRLVYAHHTHTHTLAPRRVRLRSRTHVYVYGAVVCII